MSGHTPTPWSLCNDGKCSCLTISCNDHPIAKVESGEWGDEYPAVRQVGASLENRYEAYIERIGYGTIAPETAQANALLIVKAVNAHATLVKALGEAIACMAPSEQPRFRKILWDLNSGETERA